MFFIDFLPTSNWVWRSGSSKAAAEYLTVFSIVTQTVATAWPPADDRTHDLRFA
jgi:hypothetical protein